MKRSSKMVFVVPASVLVALAAWLLWAGRAPAQPAPASLGEAKSSDPEPTGSAAKKVDAQKLREVQEIVSQKNREARADREAFVKDGWEMVSVPPPDHRVIGYDPKLIATGREHDLQMQLLSTVPSPDQARTVAEIARRAKEEKTRSVAVEALGHLNAPEATEALFELLPQMDANDPARSQIASLLHPTALDDPMAIKVAMLLDSPSLNDVEKQQIAFTLALIGLRDGMTLDAQAPISANARALITQMEALAKARFVKALDRQGGNP
jgi:hypothetical protein